MRSPLDVLPNMGRGLFVMWAMALGAVGLFVAELSDAWWGADSWQGGVGAVALAYGWLVLATARLRDRGNSSMWAQLWAAPVVGWLALGWMLLTRGRRALISKKKA